MKRLRPLLICEAANPEWVSVPLIGWSLSQALSRGTDAHIVTQVRNRDAFVRAGLIEGEDFTAIDTEAVAAPIYKMAEFLRGGAGKGWTTVTALSSLTYYAFEREIWKLFRGRLAAGEFDLVHRITPLTPTSQSTLARRLKKISVPFVIGPINGGVPWPPGFIDRQHAEREWLAHLRGIYRFMPAYTSTRRDAAAILVGSRHTRAQLPDWCRDRCFYLPENGIDPQRFSRRRTRTAALPIRFVFIGRLVPYKGADLLINALKPFLEEGTATLDIIGDGPHMDQVRQLAGAVDHKGGVNFRGWLKHEELQRHIENCDVLALPSVREFGGGVVLEAMAVGLAVIVADYAGPSELVTADTGIKVPFHDAESLTAGIAAAAGSLIADPERIDQLGAAGRRCVESLYIWDAKANQIVQVYDWVLGNRPKPVVLTDFDISPSDLSRSAPRR